MPNKIKDQLDKKHLLITGKTEVERKKFIDDLLEVLNFEIFRFPPNMKQFNQYLDFIKKKSFINPGMMQKLITQIKY